jgi:transcriptional regulator with XRE-family HTH domain
MYLNDWTQAQLGDQLGVSRPLISLVVNERQTLNRTARLLAERLLEDAEQKEQGEKKE